MITATGRYTTGSLIETGRSVFSGVSEIGESGAITLPSIAIAFTQDTSIYFESIPTITGAFNISASYSLFTTDSIQNGIIFTQDTSSEFIGTTIDLLVGSIYCESENLINFSGTVGIVGSLLVNVDVVLNLENKWLTGYITSNLNSNIVLVGGMNAYGILELEQDTSINLLGIVANLATLLGDLTKDSSVLCMNTKTNGVSTYTKYNFNSLFKIGSDYYGCSTSGLYKLVGDTDAGSEIQATLSTPVQDFDSQKLKAIRDCYAYIRSSGDTNVRLITNEQTDRSGYVLAYDNVDGIHRRRVKVAQGLRGTTWQCIITNESGAAFELKQVDVIPKELDRSI